MGPVGADNAAHLFNEKPWLDYATFAWYALASVISISAGAAAGSIALAGFGYASVIQSALAALVLWRLRGVARRNAGREEQAVARKILFILGVTFFLLSLYVLNEAGSMLFYSEKPRPSAPGIILSCLALLAMAVLAVLRLRSARARQSKILLSAARENTIGIYPPLMLFFGLSLNIRHGWWWADPLAALLMLPFVLRQGWRAIEDSKESAALSRETNKLI